MKNRPKKIIHTGAKWAKRKPPPVAERTEEPLTAHEFHRLRREQEARDLENLKKLKKEYEEYEHDLRKSTLPHP